MADPCDAQDSELTAASQAASEPEDEPIVVAGARRKALLRAEGVSKYYPLRRGLTDPTHFVRAVDNVGLYLRRSETLAVVGESGSGKTTLAKTLLRLTEPTYGRIVFDELDVLRLSSRRLGKLRAKMQMIFQDASAALTPTMRVGAAIAEPLRIHGRIRNTTEERERVASLLTRVGLSPDLEERYPLELSTGERQRIAIARALAPSPELLICDDPLGPLDVSTQRIVLNLFSDLQDELGLAYLFISNDLGVVRRFSHRVAVMYLGRVVETGPAALVLERPAHPYTRALMAAMPTPDPTRRRLRIVLEDEPADLLHPPTGCTFHPRCPRATLGVCDRDIPLLREIEAGTQHSAACFFPGDP